MAKPRLEKRMASLELDTNLPLLGVVHRKDGRDIVRYFTDAKDLDTSSSDADIQRTLGLFGAWSDLDWDTVERELDAIRHEVRPTPPLDEL